MNRRILKILTIGFSLSFLVFVFDLTSNISNLKRDLLESSNIIDVTSIITTKLKISEEDFLIEGKWSQNSFEDDSWKEVTVPKHRLVSEPEYAVGKFAYYRIRVPKTAFRKIPHLKDEISIALSYIHFKSVEIALNGQKILTNNPRNGLESIIIIPIDENKDNLISVKGHINTGDTGIDHRDPIMLGRTAELNELHRASYKGVTVFPLVFILTKGSILFIFALIYLLLNVDRSFEKFLYFGFCTLIEELITGDYLYGPLNFNQMVYLYNFVNIGAVIAVFMFFSDLLNIERYKSKLKMLTVLLVIISTIVSIDALYSNIFVDIALFMKFWNLVMVVVMAYFLPRMFKQEKMLFCVILISISLYLWSALISSNVGLNMKAYGNLLLFFMVGYQTFALFRREQLQLRKQELKLLEQEKDVAIGKTAKLLAHDVRRPMDLMHILLDKINTGDINQEFIDSAKKDIEFSIANVSCQISDIINISKSNRIELHEMSLYKTLAASIRQVMSINNGMDLQLQYDFKGTNKILADESRLASALVNIITNAVEAIKDIGGSNQGLISFSTESNDSGFHLRIFNNGPSIPEKILNEIFKPLFTSGKSKGTGLGLSSVTKAVNDLQGSVRVDNKSEGGVEFSFIFKAIKSQDFIDYSKFLNSSKGYGYFENKAAPKAEKPKFRLFLLEDESQTVQYFQHLLTQLPYDVSLTVANDYESGVEAINRQRYDLYILDYDIGELKTGYDFYLENLHYLKSEVVFHSSRDLFNPNELKLQFYPKPMLLNDLTHLCMESYQARLRILFVDDTKLFRVAWASFHGIHNIITASSPEEALKVIEDPAVKIDLCVLDYNFENSSINGLELAKQVSNLRSELKIVISSSADQEVPGVKTISKRDYEVRKLQW